MNFARNVEGNEQKMRCIASIAARGRTRNELPIRRRGISVR
ncbi:hypothetical protein [Bacillus sp. AAVF1]|nr:hypothetical protein [Bacillus sp. AAVF1]MEC4199763.1 hypothetical protein [Bacillus sp. AAVF1]